MFVFKIIDLLVQLKQNFIDLKKLTPLMAQSAGTAEYTNCISAERKESPNEYPGYDTKQSDGEAPVMLKL